MEGVLIMHGSLDRSISQYKSHIRSPTKSQPFVSRSYDHNSSPSSAHLQTKGILQAPPPPPPPRPFLSHSYPPYTRHQQPPLLPLPVTNPRRSAAAPSRSRSLVNKKPNNGSKKPRSPKKEERTNSSSPKKSLTPVGPAPNQLPKVLPLMASGTNYMNRSNHNTNSLRSSIKAAEDVNQADIFSGSAAFSTSPPPSSLPLPTFSLRPKLSCNAEAAATDDLRRLLRLR